MIVSAWKKQRWRGRSVASIAAAAWRVLRESGVKGVAEKIRLLDDRRRFREDYRRWISVTERVDQRYLDELRQRIEALDRKPLISVLMPVYNTDEGHLRGALESVLSQVYRDWELCIADDASTKAGVRDVLTEYCARDARIKVAWRETNGHIAAASNTALELVSGEWTALLDHDDILPPHALAEVALEIARRPDAELIYSDEDKLGPDDARTDPFFKPDFSRELFRAQNYLNHLTVHRTKNIRAVGGWHTEFDGSQDYDLNLRIFEKIEPSQIRHIPKILYHWRASIDSTASKTQAKEYAYANGMKALGEHVARCGLDATVAAAPGVPYFRLQHALPDPPPLVSLIIPTKDGAKFLRRCIGSIRDRTKYANYEIVVVDNGSRDPETVDYLREIEKIEGARVLRYDRPFNFSAINNFAVAEAKGSIIGLINDDIEVISPDWLKEMVSWAAQPDIGCVGAKLIYANETIQHAGVILGIGGVAGHSHKYFPRSSNGYFSRLKLVQNLSAVTAACLLVRKEVYWEVGGFTEELAVAFNDVDFCLKVRAAGYLNVWTPYAELYHFESASRGAEDNPEKVRRFQSEINYMQRHWELHDDPYYSPHLSRTREDFSL